MPTEIERKFLVDPKKLPSEALEKFYDTEAGYFTKGPVAIRVTSRVGGKQKVCFKGPVTDTKTGARVEVEVIIPNEYALELLELSPTNLKKRRHDYQGWEIDFFPSIRLNDFEQLWMAEWEEREGKPQIPNPLPEWIRGEVTGDPVFSNQNLAWRWGRKEK